jgi:two-component system NtrC family sensor kinase
VEAIHSILAVAPKAERGILQRTPARLQLVTTFHSVSGRRGQSMNSPVADRGTPRQPAGAIQNCSYLFRRYVFWFAAAVAIVLIANCTIGSWFFHLGQRALLNRVQQQQTEAAATRIALFVKEIEAQMRWLTQVPSNAASLDEWHFESVRVLRQVPAITELTRIDATGREQVWVSRIAVDVVGGRTDFSRDPKFVQAMASKRYYSPVYFRRDSEPYMTLAIAGASEEYGVVVAEVNLKFIWRVISEISGTLQGTAFVIDTGGRLIAHPDMSLVLRNTDLSHLAYGERPPRNDIQHQKPLTMYAAVPSLGWTLILCRSKEPPAKLSGG